MIESKEINKSFERYPAYKDSGLEWLGEIPEGWDVKKVFHYYRAEKGRKAAVLTREFCGTIKGDYPVYSGQTENKGIMASINEYEFDYSEEGCLFTTTVGAKAMSVSFIQEKFSLSQNCMIIIKRNNEVLNKFIFYQFQTMFKFYRNLIPDHMQASFRMEDLYQYRFILPSLAEQTAIANFLDDKTNKIDTVIAQKEQMIELLKERKQIIIQNAVTGKWSMIDGKWTETPKEQMKDSGVEWIGEIPEYYSISKLGLCLKPFSIKNRPDLPLLSITRELGVIVRDIEDQESNHNFIPDDLSGYKVIRKGQFGMNKMKAWQGSYGVSQYDGIISPAYYVFDLISDINPDFFHLAVRSKIYVPFFASASDGVRIGQWDLNKSRMKEIPIVVPPIKEQIRAIQYVDDQSRKIEETILLQQSQIEKLKEYKATLIDSAVTGKIKVTD